MNWTSLSTHEVNPAVQRWQQQQKKSPERRSQWLEPREKKQGRGGGVFVALRNSREDSYVSLNFDGVSAGNNSASVGGNAPFVGSAD